MSDSTVVVRPDLKAELERLAAQTRRDEFATDEEVRDFFAERSASHA